jgi:hypothetical protein
MQGISHEMFRKGLPRYHVENDNILPLTLIYFPIEIYNLMCKEFYNFDMKKDILHIRIIYTCSQCEYVARLCYNTETALEAHQDASCSCPRDDA